MVGDYSAEAHDLSFKYFVRSRRRQQTREHSSRCIVSFLSTEGEHDGKWHILPPDNSHQDTAGTTTAAVCQKFIFTKKECSHHAGLHTILSICTRTHMFDTAAIDISHCMFGKSFRCLSIPFKVGLMHSDCMHSSHVTGAVSVAALHGGGTQKAFCQLCGPPLLFAVPLGQRNLLALLPALCRPKRRLHQSRPLSLPVIASQGIGIPH